MQAWQTPADAPPHAFRYTPTVAHRAHGWQAVFPAVSVNVPFWQGRHSTGVDA